MNKKLIRLTEGDLHRMVKESVKRVLNEHISSKEDFVIKYINDMTENGDAIYYNNGNIQFIKKDDNGNNLVIAEITNNNEYREYYKKNR